MDHRYIFDLDVSATFGDITDAHEKLEALSKCATDLGLEVHGGTVAIARESDPIEYWRLGSERPYHNMTSQQGTPQAERFFSSLGGSVGSRSTVGSTA
jgi:hypothetical protein